MCFTCRGGSRGVGCLTKLNGPVIPGGSAKEKPSRARGEGEGNGGSWDHMSSKNSGRLDLLCFTTV